MLLLGLGAFMTMAHSIAAHWQEILAGTEPKHRAFGTGYESGRREIPSLRGQCSLRERGKRLAPPAGMTGLGGKIRLA